MTEISLDHLDRQLQRVLTELAELRQQVAALSGQPAQAAELHERWCTIDHFMKMLGYKTRVSYYNHVGDPGFPQRVYSGSKAYLIHSECVAYLKKVEADRTLPASPPLPAKKRHPGRPAKLHAQA